VNIDTENILSILKVAVKKAGDLLIDSVDETVFTKTNSKDFYTASDIKSQNIIKQYVAEHLPNIKVVSEEDDPSEISLIYEDNFTGLVIDPIDGTYNFKRGMMESAVSAGYIHEGSPLVGVTYDPYKKEMFWAVRGQGAFCNDKRIEVSKKENLDESSIAISNSYDDEAMVKNLQRHLVIYEEAKIMPWTNCLGSGIIIMTHLACGIIIMG
jgi:myo-inositol-1(or 4)-monophosphatase